MRPTSTTPFVRVRAFLPCTLGLTTLLASCCGALAQEPATNAPTTAVPAAPATTTAVPATPPNAVPRVRQPADEPAAKLGATGNVSVSFLAYHQKFLDRAKTGPVGLLFMGDSITAGWQIPNGIWKNNYGKYNPANFGIPGDGTQHVLWRIVNGELDGIAPKVVVLLIGTNNVGYPAEDIVKGNAKIVAEIHLKLPAAKVLLMGIFPRGADATKVAPMRAKIKAINLELAKLDDGDKTRFLDIGDKFLDADGNLPADIMPDTLHPSAKGYQIWVDAMAPLLAEMMK